MAYTVDEVSDLLDVPRPTLYRYLREYTIPHLRRSGKIYVPEESFDRIKEVRELHKEGLATESVRRRLHEESNLDADGLTERLDRISEALESLQGNPKPANGVSSAQTLQTILARQSVLISAVSNVTEMLEDLIYLHGGRPPKADFSDPAKGTREQKPLPKQPEKYPEPAEVEPPTNGSMIVGAPSTAKGSLTVPAQRRKFGVMARRRRRGALAVLLVLLASTALVVYAVLGNEEGTGPSLEEPSASPQETTPVASEETPAKDAEVAPSDPVDHQKEEPARYAEGGYEGFAPEQPFVQPEHEVQDVAPGSPPQEPPALQPQLEPPIPQP